MAGLERQSQPEPVRSAPDASPVPGGLQGERRIITALFCDVADSTALAEQQDPEEWAELINEAFQYVIGAVQRYEGTVVRFLGDAILAFFGAPQAHEDDPERAILAGLAMIENLTEFRERLRRDYDVDFNVRIGINTGPVVVGAVAAGAGAEYTALGDAVNVAARMQQTAQPGTIQISGDTYRLVESLFDVDPLGEIEVKGKREPITAYRVLAYRAPSIRLHGVDRLSSPLTGRDRELQLLGQLIEDVKSGRGQIICLVAEAGLGKSRLIDELHRQGRAEFDSEVIWHECRGISYDTARPYGMFQQLLRQVFGVMANDTAEAIHDRVTGHLDELFGGDNARIAMIIELLITPGADPNQQQISGEDFRRSLFDTLYNLVLRRARQAPLVLVFDDLHWVDAASADLLLHLFWLVEQTSILFLCALRPERGSHGWRIKQAVETDYPHRATVMQLQPLSLPESEALIGNLLTTSGLPDRLTVTIREKTEGNPLFVEEVVRAVMERAAVGGDEHTTVSTVDITIPETVQALLLSRIDQLGTSVRTTLQLAAVIGRLFPVQLLHHLSSPTNGFEQHLNLLERAGLIQEVGRIPERQYSFRHDLMRDAAYSSILRRQRRSFHRRVAEAIEASYPDRLDDEANRLAYHFAEAGETDRALYYARLAGENARQLFANAEAITHLSHALSLAVDAARPAAEIIDLRIRRADVLSVNGEFERARLDYEAAAELAQASNDPLLEWRAVMGLGGLWGGLDYSQAGACFGHALELAEQINDPLTIARSLLQVSNWLVNTERPDEARDRLLEALPIFEKMGDKRGVAETLDLLGIAEDIGGDMVRMEEYFERAVILYRELNDRHGLASVLASLAAISSAYLFETIVLPGRNSDRYSAYGKESLAITREIGWRAGESYALLCLGILAASNRDVARALDYSHQSLEIAEAIRHGEWRTAAHNAFGMIFRDLLDYDRAYLHCEQALKYARESGALHWMNLGVGLVAKQHIMIGAVEQAETLLATIDPELPMRTIGQRQIWLARAILNLAQGNESRTIAIVDTLIAGAVNFKDEGDIPELAKLRGEALMALGQSSEAEHSLRAALNGATVHGIWPLIWQLHLALARLYRSTGRDAEAGEEIQAARAFVHESAMDIPEGELRDGFLARTSKLIDAV